MTKDNHNGYPVFRYYVEYRITGGSKRISKTHCDQSTLKALKRNGSLVRIIRKVEING